MRDAKISILTALLIATSPAAALAHGHGHHGSGSPGGFAFVPIFMPRIVSPGAFVVGPPGARFGPPDPLVGPWGAPAVVPGWQGLPHGSAIGWPSQIGVMTGEGRSEAARESDLDQQIGALPPPPAGAPAPPADKGSGEDDSGWQPL
ncbi:MAG TPA: hypothetical protein VMH82_00050 [Myxococcota bacterium]|nr:hypothetical protein [Myxococcota bacterium]